ncbi:hypothetical protein LTR50_005458 [Elasticomyces elasticus]|nr:hypothetical protein LTR50_005458 [Elasticomyces elasticus]
MATQTVTAMVNYHLEVERGGAAVWCPGTVMDKRRPHDHQAVTITNIRNNQSDFALDTHGFEVRPFSTSATNFDDNEAIAKQYYPDVCAHVQKVTGANKVVPVVHIARRQPWEKVAEAEKELPDMAPVTAPAPNRSVHVDQSYFGAELVRDSKLEEFPKEEAEKLKKGRWAIINLWRPFDEVRRDNLALCDARSVSEKDLAAVYADIPDSLRNAKTGYNFAAKSRSEAWEVKAGEPGAHKWYYAAGMRPDEALLIKQYDSSDKIAARRCPHTAFTTDADHGPTRQSIEVRCLAFWDDQ